jgi:hypothetical protein
MTFVVAVATVLIEQVTAAIRQGQDPLTSVERPALEQALIPKVSVRVIT